MHLLEMDTSLRYKDFAQVSGQEIAMATKEWYAIVCTVCYVMQVHFKLSPDVEVLDTRSTRPRRSFFVQEARSQFPVLHFPLESLAHLEQYWYTLHNVCVATPIILGGWS